MASSISLGCFVGLVSVFGTGCLYDSMGMEAEAEPPPMVEPEPLKVGTKHAGDTLYVADVFDDSVKLFDINTGKFKGTFVSPGSGGLFGPRGLTFDLGNLLVVNQNVDQPFPGEVLRYQKKTGEFTGSLVSQSNPKAPYAPRGIVQKDSKIYVADMGAAEYVFSDEPPPNPLPARVAIYDKSGRWLQDIAYEGFEFTCTPEAGCVQWSPRGLVFGPDGNLYVSLMKFVRDADPNLEAGRVIRIDDCGEVEVLVDGETCNCGLARPEGLVFGPSGQLYVTSFRKGAADTDKILVFHGKTGEYLDKIDLYRAGAPRAFAEAIVFGPGGKLYVPISGSESPDTGSVRRYDVRSKQYDVVVPAGGGLSSPWFLIFGASDPATFAFQ